MHLVYNAFEDRDRIIANPEEDILISQLKGYNMACEKYASELAAIRNYFPGWMPALNIQS